MQTSVPPPMERLVGDWAQIVMGWVVPPPQLLVLWLVFARTPSACCCHITTTPPLRYDGRHDSCHGFVQQTEDVVKMFHSIPLPSFPVPPA